MHGDQYLRGIAERLALAFLVLPMLGAGKNPPLPEDAGVPKATAQTLAQIRHPVILRAGAILRDTQIQISQARERECVSGDLPDSGKCRLIVSDIE